MFGFRTGVLNRELVHFLTKSPRKPSLRLGKHLTEIGRQRQENQRFPSPLLCSEHRNYSVYVDANVIWEHVDVALMFMPTFERVSHSLLTGHILNVDQIMPPTNGCSFWRFSLKLSYSMTICQKHQLMGSKVFQTKIVHRGCQTVDVYGICESEIELRHSNSCFLHILCVLWTEKLGS